MTSAEKIVKESEYNSYCVAIYAINCTKRGYKQLLKDAIGQYKASIIIKTPIKEICALYNAQNGNMI